MKKCYRIAILIFGLVLLCAVTTIAQVAELHGHVFMQQPSGQKVPLANAQVDVFRVDIKGTYNTTTNTSGEFVLPSLPFIGTYIVAVSHPTAAPKWVTGVKAGRDPIRMEVTPGDGRRLTYEDIKTLQANAAIEASNKKAAETNEILARTFRAGNEFLGAASTASKSGSSDEAIQNYTAAIAQYDEGLAADREQPAILTNKAVAIKGRGVERYNATLRSKTLDDAAKSAGLQRAKDDFRLAAEVSTQAVAMLKSQAVPSDTTDLQRYNRQKYAAMFTRAESMRLFITKVDQTKADEGANAFRDYITIESDPVKKTKAQLDMAQMLLDSGFPEKALTEFQVVLASDPNNLNANLGAGMAIYASDDKSRQQQAIPYFQRFVNQAPDSNPYKDAAKFALEDLKSDVKPSPPKTKPTNQRP